MYSFRFMRSCFSCPQYTWVYCLYVRVLSWILGPSVYEGCSLISAIGLVTFTVSALWQCALYQMKAGSFPNRQIPNTDILIYARLFGNIAV